MALKSNNTAVALTVESTSGTFNTPNTTTDLLPCANLSLKIDGITVANPEYTGSPHKQGDALAGKNATLSFDVMLRGYGASLPSAGASLIGRILRCSKFTENLITTAIPAAPEAIGASPTTTSVTLGTSATGTLDLYKGLALLLSDNQGGARPKGLTAIKAYSAGKVALLPETLGAAPAANYQIPTQLAYQRDVSSTDSPTMSTKVWLDGHRYDLVGLAATVSFSIEVSSKDGAALPIMRVTLTGDVYGDADEATPSIPSLGAIPLFKDGDFWVANKSIGGSSFSMDMGMKVAYAPNPNKPSGSDPSQLVEVKPTVSLKTNAALKATLDTIALADAQGYYSVWLQWGYTAGYMVSILITDARFNYRSPDIGGDFVMEDGDMFIDVASKNINIIFP